jgi:hypothetical protein
VKPAIRRPSANPLTAFSDKLILFFADSFPEEDGSRRPICFATIFVRPFISTLLVACGDVGLVGSASGNIGLLQFRYAVAMGSCAGTTLHAPRRKAA